MEIFSRERVGSLTRHLRRHLYSIVLGIMWILLEFDNNTMVVKIRP